MGFAKLVAIKDLERGSRKPKVQSPRRNIVKKPEGELDGRAWLTSGTVGTAPSDMRHYNRLLMFVKR
jgi:hypothetical protein